MNKFAFFCVSLAIIFVSCTTQNNQGVEHLSALVNETELLVSKYDTNVQNALDRSQYDSIKVYSTTTIDSINFKLDALKGLNLKPSIEGVRTLALAYVKSLQKTVIAQESYGSITNSTSMSDAKEMDARFNETVEYAKKLHDLYLNKLNTLAN